MKLVLILILMDYSLRKKEKSVDEMITGLNPYSNGLLSEVSVPLQVTEKVVLILILMDYSLRIATFGMNNMPTSLNPYSNGLLSETKPEMYVYGVTKTS